MIISKDSTPEQKEALRKALRQQSLQMAVRGAAPEDIQGLPEDFEPPSYSENTRPLYDGQLFPKITSADDLIANGYATPDGQPTEQGKMAISLKKVGALNDDYTLNNTGRMMLASQDDLLKEENIDLYREYKRLEFDEAPDVGIWDMAKGIAADLVKGANAIAENELGGIKDIASSQAFGGAFEPYGAEPLTPEKRAESRIRTEEAAKDLFVSSAGLMRAAATEIDKVAAKTMWDGMMQDYQVAYLEQKYDRDLADIEKVNTAEVADELAKVIGLSTQFAEGRQQAEELLGPEASQKAIEEGRAAGLALSVVNPLAPEALVARTGFAAARKGVSAAFKPISRKLLESEAKAAQALQARQRVTGLQGNLAQVNYLAQKAEQEAVFAERQADKYSRLGLTNRANDARAFADKLRTRGLEAGAKVQGLTDEIARASEEASKLAQDAAVADKINFIAQKAREIPGLPIQAIGGLVEGTGMAMIGIDKGLSKLASKIGADKVYNTMNKITTLSGLGTVVSAAGVGPAAFIPAAIKTAWSTAPFLKGAGHFVRMIGKETANARELIPFWQRVANYETLGATQRSIAHLMDTSTLGSRVTGLAGDVAKGMAAAYPVDLAFEWISEGGEMDMNTLKQAAAETVVFGGGGALGGITAGSKERIKKLQRGSALNFYRNIKDGSQRVAFNALNDGMKRSIGTYSAAFPNLNIRFTDQGGGAFDPASNTAFINPMSRNPLKPLLAHEINHYILIRNQMEGGISAALVGDGVQTGGLLRGKDGKLDENFLAFKEEYTRRLEAQHNRQINQKIAAGEKVPAKQRQFIAPTDNDIAIEYFVDSMADDMMEMAETGELGKQAGRMLVNRKMQAFGNAILQKAPIIKDFFYKLGGVTDQNGRAVYGNGLLAEGIREIPQMKKLFRQMISESAGRPMHVAKVTKGESEGHTIPITGKNDPILDEMTSMYESDENGVPLRDKNGDRIPLSDETERLRASSGLLLLEDQENRLNRGETLEDGELRFNPEENAWTGEYLTDRQIQILRASGRFNNAQMRQLEMLNGAAQENTGRRFLVFNQPATKKRKGKRLDYETLGISMREIVPYGIKITKDGNILVRLMSVQQLHANAFEKAASKRGQSLYRGDVEAILRDVNQVIENHGRNEPTDAYFKREYGTEWEVRKNFINTVFGNVGKGQKDMNPLLAAEKAKNAVVKTYRIDRINKATELEGRTKLPYQNHLVKVNFMPEGEPILDENGEPKDLRYMPEVAVVPERFTGSKEDVDRRGKYVEPPGFFKRFNIGSYERGGRFFDASNGEDLTGKQYATGSIDVSTGKPRLFVDNISDVTKSGAKFKTNLFKQSAGWKWTSENPPSTSTIVSVEGQGRHVYSLKANFESGVELTRYSEKKSEPRLRPTAYGELKLGNKVGEISIRGKLHPVYDSIGVTAKAQGSRFMPEGVDLSPEDLNPIANRQEAEGLFADGKRIFAFHEMDEKFFEITSLDVLKRYPPDSMGWMEPDTEPTGQMRFMPESEKATPAEVLQELDSTNFIPRKMAAKILGPFPEYLTPVADFIAKQREKLVSGTITPRDVWKAYAMTVASQGTGAVSVDLLRDKLAKVGIDFNPTDLFTDIGKSGQRTIRPEEAAAYWLGTPEGKRALDNAESGNTSPSDWDGLVQVRKAYGDDRFKTFNVFSDKNLSKIPVVVDQLNQSKGNSKKVLDAVQLLNGVSTGKKGFISHLLGLGNTPTIDAVEINFWLTGKGDVGTLKTKEADLARKIKDTFSDKRVREEMFNRVDNSINLLRDVAEGGKKVPKEVWSHVMHHWLWDKAKGLETTHAGMYEAQMRFMPEGERKTQPIKQWNPNPIVATNKTARAKGIPERITDELFELIKNKPIVVGMADLLGAGGKIRGVDVSGGPGYPIQNFDPANPDAITGVWASERGGINTILQNMVKTDSIWQDESGHNWALFAPHTMAQSAHKSNAQTPEIYISKVNDMAISGALKKATAIDLSDHIRANVPTAKDMPNIGTEKLTKFIHDAAFETRAAIMSELSNVRSRDLGAPSPETILTESRDPQYHGVEKNALTGLLLIDVDRLATKDENGNWKLRNDLSADDFNVPKHPSYGTVMPGRVLVHFDNPVPFRISTPEMINTMRAASPLSRIDYLLARMPKDKGIKFQPLTNQIKNAINEAQNISGNVPYIREAVKAVNGNWRKFTSGASLKGLSELIGAIHRSPARDSLTQYTLSDLQKMIKEDKMEVHQLGDNDIWFGVKKSKDGNELVSVVNNTGIPGMLNLIMQRALEVGVNKLDAYAVPTPKTPNGLLPSLYKRYGWKEVERMPFDRQYLIERKKGEKKSDHEAKIAQKEAALKMFWTEQGWDGQSNPDVVFMTYEKGRKTEITSGQSEGSLVRQRVAESGTASEATSGEVRGAGLVGGREQAPVGGPTQGDSGTSEGVLPRGFDSIVQSLRSASPIQIETIGITDAERKQFLKKLGVE